MFCGLFRLMISQAVDGDNQLSGLTKKHIHHCASCQEFYQTCLSLAKGLKREAAIPCGKVSEGLSTRILTAIPRRQIETYKMKVKLWPILTAACVGLIVLTGVLFLAGRRYRQNTKDGQVIVQLPNIFTTYELLGSRLGEKNSPKAWPGLIEKPLASELDNLVVDTESAVRFLVACVAVDFSNTNTNH